MSIWIIGDSAIFGIGLALALLILIPWLMKSNAWLIWAVKFYRPGAKVARQKMIHMLIFESSFSDMRGTLNRIIDHKLNPILFKIMKYESWSGPTPPSKIRMWYPNVSMLVKYFGIQYMALVVESWLYNMAKLNEHDLQYEAAAKEIVEYYGNDHALIPLPYMSRHIQVASRLKEFIEQYIKVEQPVLAKKRLKIL